MNPDTQLPQPFNESIILYDNEFLFPDNAMYGSQEQSIEFIKLDSNNIVHAVILNMHRYYIDSASDEKRRYLC
ncbi:MAG: hypothetical protein OMM_12763 [Candidatus Magnetoglobus multicellularis str. Araruama]|uniref:Uncharacterized protein n=1 Tax=Candidatus Magnetoglobus multicellularis str. Araruama TaxID=890399 RepID=A0A1V1NV36_9BACT|nr:MAG: hypothetical protein OMM_12763 [Candidatus Magnetoglobus multicellularis str. Araruama]